MAAAQRILRRANHPILIERRAIAQQSARMKSFFAIGSFLFLISACASAPPVEGTNRATPMAMRTTAPSAIPGTEARADAGGDADSAARFTCGSVHCAANEFCLAI